MPAPPRWTKQKTRDELDRFDRLSRKCYSNLTKEWAVGLHEDLKELQELCLEIFAQKNHLGFSASTRDRLRVTATSYVNYTELETVAAGIENIALQLGKARHALSLIKDEKQ